MFKWNTEYWLTPLHYTFHTHHQSTSKTSSVNHPTKSSRILSKDTNCIVQLNVFSISSPMRYGKTTNVFCTFFMYMLWKINCLWVGGSIIPCFLGIEFIQKINKGFDIYYQSLNYLLTVQQFWEWTRLKRLES